MTKIDWFGGLDRTPQDIPLRDAAATSLIGTIVIVAVSLTSATAAYVALSGFSAPQAAPSMGGRAVAAPCGGSIVQVVKSTPGLRWNDVRAEFHGLEHWEADGLGVSVSDGPWLGSSLGNATEMTSGQELRVEWPEQEGMGSVLLVHEPSKAVIFRADLPEQRRDREAPSAAFSGLSPVERAPEGLAVSAFDVDCSGLALVEVALQRAEDSLYWDGAAFASSTPVWLPAASLGGAGANTIGWGIGPSAGASAGEAGAPTSWSLPLDGVDFWNNATYEVIVRATDESGNTQTSGAALAPTPFRWLADADDGLGYYTRNGSSAGPPNWEVFTEVPGAAANLSWYWLEETAPGQAINENTAVFTVRVKAENGALLWVAKVHDHFGEITIDAWDRQVAEDASVHHFHVENAVPWFGYMSFWDQRWGILDAVDEYDGNLTIEYGYGNLARGDWNASMTASHLPLPSGNGMSGSVGGGSGGSGGSGGGNGGGNGR